MNYLYPYLFSNIYGLFFSFIPAVFQTILINSKSTQQKQTSEVHCDTPTEDTSAHLFRFVPTLGSFCLTLYGLDLCLPICWHISPELDLQIQVTQNSFMPSMHQTLWDINSLEKQKANISLWLQAWATPWVWANLGFIIRRYLNAHTFNKKTYSNVFELCF